jgi:hypothetical protein
VKERMSDPSDGSHLQISRLRRAEGHDKRVALSS